MKFEEHDKIRDITLTNYGDKGIKKTIETLLESVINEVREEVLNDNMNEMFDSMKSNGLNNVDEYILSIIDEKISIDTISVKVSSRYTGEQVDELNKCSETLSKEELDLVVDSNIPYENMRVIREAMKKGLPIEMLEMIDASKFCNDSILILKRVIEEGYNMDELKVLINTEGYFGAHNILAVKEILDKHGIESARFASDKEFDIKKKYAINSALNNGVELSSVKDLFDKKLMVFW